MMNYLIEGIIFRGSVPLATDNLYAVRASPISSFIPWLEAGIDYPRYSSSFYVNDFCRCKDQS